MIAEVVYMDDQGIWHVLQLNDMPDKTLIKLLEHEYGIRSGWIREIQRKPAPRRYSDPAYKPKGAKHKVFNFENDRHCRRFLPTGEFADKILGDYEN